MSRATRRHRRRRSTAAAQRYELFGCALHGHELVGTDAATIRVEDELVVREVDGLRWYRCLRCDAWIHALPPDPPTRDVPPSREEITVPLRGRALRDRYVLRLIAADRMLRFLVLVPIAIAVIFFARDKARLHGEYTKVLAGFQSAFGVPINNFGTVELNKLFALKTSELYLAGVALGVYALLLGVEAIGLWGARRWAEYLTFLETGVFVPFEIDALTKSVTTLRILALVLNLLVLGYLLITKRLFGIRGGAAAASARHEDDSGWPALERTTPGQPVSAAPTTAESAPAASLAVDEPGHAVDSSPPSSARGRAADGEGADAHGDVVGLDLLDGQGRHDDREE